MNLILNASDVRETEMVAARDLTWASLPATIDINYLIHQNDMRIKASTLGSFLESMLNAKAKDKLLHMKTLFTVQDENGDEYIDGPTYWWCLTALVQPYNDYSIHKLQNKLRNLRAKQYHGDVKAMLVVWSNTITQIQDMGGDVSDSNYHKDFWDAVTSHVCFIS